MSEQDDTLLDEDLGDEEYNLGNDEEEALLADDYELHTQNSYKGEEETDDILDLGVTDDALDDDLEGEDENLQYVRNVNNNDDGHNHHIDFYNNDGTHKHGVIESSSYYKEEDGNIHQNHRHLHHHHQLQRCEGLPNIDGINSMPNNIDMKGDLREKLNNRQQRIEDDEAEEGKERRNRFQNERTMVAMKMNQEIPDSLENVVTSEQSRQGGYRGRGRGRGGCIRGNRGGRFNNIPSPGNFNPRFGVPRNPNFENQPPQSMNRPPLILGTPPNSHVYQQTNLQPYQQFTSNGPPSQPPHFLGNRPHFNPNDQCQGPVRNQNPRPSIGPRPNFLPRNSGAILPFNYPGPYSQQPPQNVNFSHNDNQPPLLHGHPGGRIVNPNIPGLMMPSGNQMLQRFPLRQQGQGLLPTLSLQNHPGTFENRPHFQGPNFDPGRPIYNTRPNYIPEQMPNNQFNNNHNLSMSQLQPLRLPPPQQQSTSSPSASTSVSNVALPPGHKILINPHFRGVVQPGNDPRLAWDPSQQHTLQHVENPDSYHNQGSYCNQIQQSLPDYKTNFQQIKNDDPYAYFSDVWQENKSQKPDDVSPNKQFSSECNFTRKIFNDTNKYHKNDNWDKREHFEEGHKTREKDSLLRQRNNYPPKRVVPSHGYRNDEQKSSFNRSTGGEGGKKFAEKRTGDSLDRNQRDSNPKRLKTNRHVQEIHKMEILNEPAKKEEENDPEMEEYRKKMEEQKRLRETILREKENRRKMAAMDKKQNEDNKNEIDDSGTEKVQQETTSSLSVNLENTTTVACIKNRPVVTKGRGNLPINTQTTEETNDGKTSLRIIRTIQNTESINDSTSTETIAVKDINIEQSNIQQCAGSRRVVIKKPFPNVKTIPTTIQKKISNLQKGQQIITLPNTKNPLIQKIVQAQSVQITNRQKTIFNAQDSQGNVQNSQRIVVQKVSPQVKKSPEIKTTAVKIENLAVSTSEAQIRRMCQGLGSIQSIHMGEGTATVVFKTHSAAMVFHKKYQRKMIDLSMITVRLIPPINDRKSPLAVNKITN